jgi:hypothetical protein
LGAIDGGNLARSIYVIVLSRIAEYRGFFCVVASARCAEDMA